MLGVSQMATRMQEGGIIAPVDVNFPYALVFEPDRQLKHVPCDFGNVTSQLQVTYGREKVIIQWERERARERERREGKFYYHRLFKIIGQRSAH